MAPQRDLGVRLRGALPGADACPRDDVLLGGRNIIIWLTLIYLFKYISGIRRLGALVDFLHSIGWYIA